MSLIDPDARVRPPASLILHGLGIKGRDLASVIGYTPEHTSAVLTGAVRPSPRFIAAVSLAIDVPASDLFPTQEQP